MPSPRVWREFPQRYRLEANRCKKCHAIFFPPRLICSNCRSEEFEIVKLQDRGKIVSFTTIRTAPKEFSLEAPYNIAIVELNDGVRITAQVVDCRPEDLSIGKDVRIVFRKIQEEGEDGIRIYGYKCVIV